MKPKLPRPSLARITNTLVNINMFRRIISRLGILTLSEHIKTIHCLGDSHLRYFMWADKNQIWLNTRFKFFQVPGATAMGMANPNSKTNAMESFVHYISNLDLPEILLFSLGEVDCGFVIWYRAEKYGETVEEQLDRSLNNYFTFVDRVIEMHAPQIIISSVPLPTIQDGQDWGEVANLRREISASLRERTELTFLYNKRLKEFCQENGHEFLDFTSDTLDPGTGLIADSFLEKNPLDHHLNAIATGKLVARKLREKGFS